MNNQCQRCHWWQSLASGIRGRCLVNSPSLDPDRSNRAVWPVTQATQRACGEFQRETGHGKLRALPIVTIEDGN